MIIAIEGPDGSGKTTLLSALIKLPVIRDFDVWHSGGPVLGPADYINRMNFVKSHADLVVDRLPSLSEVVYCSAMGRPFPLPATEMWHELITLNPIIVYCSLFSSSEMLELMLANKPHKSATYYDQLRQNHSKVCEKYRTLINEASNAGLFVVRANWKVKDNTAESIQAVLREVIRRRKK